MTKVRPLVITIEQRQGDDTYPTGLPIATGFRGMTWWEYKCYQFRNWLNRRTRIRTGPSVGKSTSLMLGHAISVGVEISEKEYARLIGREVISVSCRNVHTMDLIPPPNPQTKEELAV